MNLGLNITQNLLDRIITSINKYPLFKSVGPLMSPMMHRKGKTAATLKKTKQNKTKQNTHTIGFSYISQENQDTTLVFSKCLVPAFSSSARLSVKSHYVKLYINYEIGKVS